MFNNILLKIINIHRAITVRCSPFFNRCMLRAKGVHFGINCTILGKISIIGPGEISIGNNFMMTSGEHINPICSNIQASILTESKETKIIIGDNVGISSTRMWISKYLTVGNNVKIGGGVLIIDTDCHELNYQVRNGSLSAGQGWGNSIHSTPITIEDDAWIGAQSIVLKGVTIGARSIIGAGSVVTKSIPADCIAAGNPCKVIREINKG